MSRARALTTTTFRNKRSDSSTKPSNSIQSIRSSTASDSITFFQTLDYKNESNGVLFKEFVTRFPLSGSFDRKRVLLAILKQCDPSDMRFLNDIIPVLHRDFLKLLSLPVVYQILKYAHPRDLAVFAQVSKVWNVILTSREMWLALYKFIGLETMAPIFFITDGSPKDNAKRYYSYGNWANGIFTSRNFQAHSLGILCMAFDGKVVATGSSDKTCKLHLVKNGACIRTLIGHDESIFAVQFDDDKIVTGSADSTIKVWNNRENGNLIQTMRDHVGPVICLKLSLDTLVSGSEDKTVRIWDLKSVMKGTTTASNLTARRCLHGHNGAVKCLDFCNDIIISGDIHGYVLIWHKSTGNCLNVLGFNPTVSEIVMIGLDSTGTEIPSSHDAILHDPISEIQFSEERLLVSTLSGYGFLHNVNPPPKIETKIPKIYESLLQWANQPGSFSRIGIYQYQPREADSNNSNKGMNGRWSLCAKNDAWRLMNGGSQGFVAVWNHRTGKFLYKLNSRDDIKPILKDISIESKQNIGSLNSFAKKDNKLDSIRALTGLSFDDSYIVASGMDGFIYIWEPNQSN